MEDDSEKSFHLYYRSADCAQVQKFTSDHDQSDFLYIKVMRKTPAGQYFQAIHSMRYWWISFQGQLIGEEFISTVLSNKGW